MSRAWRACVVAPSTSCRGKWDLALQLEDVAEQLLGDTAEAAAEGVAGDDGDQDGVAGGRGDVLASQQGVGAVGVAGMHDGGEGGQLDRPVDGGGHGWGSWGSRAVSRR